ncbi:MAG: MltA domain-containing protein [Desulfuromonadaceae bacterium]
MLCVLLPACTRVPTAVVTPPGGVISPPAAIKPLSPVGWEDIAGWERDDLRQALPPLLQSCTALQQRPAWTGLCRAAAALDGSDAAAVRTFFEEHFSPHRVRNGDGSDLGTMTGYYNPELHGSRTPSADYPCPLYGVPDDLLVVDLSSLYPELGDYRLRGRLVGRRVVPYWNRCEIDQGQEAVENRVLFWVADPVELFFLQVQGSGRILLDDGSCAMVQYGDQNGHPYRSIGKLLIDRGEMTPDQMSLQNIKIWARNHPEQVSSLLAENPSYVFFVEAPDGEDPPLGALGVPLTAQRSMAVDPRFVPLGVPVFLDTTWPGSEEPLQRLMLAQDTGGAIRGPVRADFFWGLGAQAGELAGRMKEPGRLWVLLPVQNTSEVSGDR